MGEGIMKENYLVMGLLGICSGVLFLCSGCGVIGFNPLSVGEFTEPVTLVKKSVIAYMSLSADTPISEICRQYSYIREDRNDLGLPVTLTYQLRDSVEGNIVSAIAEISETKEFEEVREVGFEDDTYQVDVYNLKTGTDYYFRITVEMDDGSTYSKDGKFSTAVSPRFMNVEGISNVRDIGGYESSLGGIVKQGMLYRGSEIDGAKNKGIEGFCLTEDGIKTMLEVLQIRTDIDLRDGNALGLAAQPYGILGQGVTRSFYNANQYQSVLNDRDGLRQLFSDLANPDAYPVYLHCTHGVDRAGTVALLLEGLLGISKEDIIRDYEMSSYYYTQVDRNFENGGNILTLIEEIEKYPGDTFAQKVENCLLEMGVTQNEIAVIRSVFLD